MATSIPMSWRWKRWFWAHWQVLRFKISKPQEIGPPAPNVGHLDVAPLGAIYPEIPLSEVKAVEHLPKEENRLGMRVVVAIGLFLARVFPQMRRGLPEIDADGATTLDDAKIGTYASAFREPVRPDAYANPGAPDLGELAVRSPYAVLTRRGDDGLLQWDLRALGDYAHHDGLCSLGLRVLFEPVIATRSLRATRIESELGDVQPGDAAWGRASLLAVCAATTNVALTRHFNYVHLISGDHWDVAARNQLPSDHPVYRLLWPHTFNSFYTNYGVTRVQLLPDGDFVNMFSFTHDGLMRLFDDMYERYDITLTDPALDWTRRELGDAEPFDHPSHDNLVELFEVMHRHARRYLELYYGSDDELRADAAVGAWLDELRGLVPNGLGAVDRQLTIADLSRLIAGYLYEGNTIHDLAGTTLWDYQLWAASNPTRVYADERRPPVDVFQRVINNNFALQIRRAPLLADYGQVALDDRGAAAFTEFYEDCRALQERYDAAPAGPWRMEPKNLEINMNG
jgi:arachidonate 15-lipoxygenase